MVQTDLRGQNIIEGLVPHANNYHTVAWVGHSAATVSLCVCLSVCLWLYVCTNRKWLELSISKLAEIQSMAGPVWVCMSTRLHIFLSNKYVTAVNSCRSAVCNIIATTHYTVIMRYGQQYHRDNVTTSRTLPLKSLCGRKNMRSRVRKDSSHIKLLK